MTGPAAILAPDASITPIDQAALSLPAAVPTPAASAPAALEANPFLVDMAPTRATRPKRRRFGKTLAVLVVVGGLAAAGVVYGPDLYDEYVEDRGETETAAPLAFPRARSAAPEVRTATFVVEGLATGSDASYTVTVDFDTRVSRVVIDRQDAPDLEVLTFSDDALVRRLDSANWFQIERGAFPLDDQLRRADWIRMIDELIPPERRSGIAIDEATVSSVAGIDTRHLVVTLDSSALTTSSDVDEQLDPIGDLANAADAGDDVAANPIDPPQVEPPGATVPAVPAPTGPGTVTPPAAGVDPAGPTTQTPEGAEPPAANGDTIQVELWVDNQGVVRRSVGADVLGASSVTILETTPEPWVPDYPDEAQVEPMTAAALIELGI